MLRGGAFKPRTSPYSFRGLGEDGLRLLAKAREATGLPIVTEVVDPKDIEVVDKYADMFQVGARNIQNFALLTLLGQARKPILLKRGPATTIDEFLMAAEYILSENNRDLVLCERGIRTFETATRNTLDVSCVPVVKAKSHLPIIIDPSHAAGQSRYVPALFKAAVAVGADGLIIEVHPDPEKALCDGAQSLNPTQFTVLMNEMKAIASAVGRRISGLVRSQFRHKQILSRNSQHHSRSTPSARIVSGKRERNDFRQLFENGMNSLPHGAAPFPMDNADLENAFPPANGQIVWNEVFYVTWLKAVQVQHAVNGDFNRFLLHYSLSPQNKKGSMIHAAGNQYRNSLL